MPESAEDLLLARLREAGMKDVPERFTIAPVHQEIPRVILAEIDAFLRDFDRVTTRPAWQESVTASAPAIARSKRSERCFFSAWDFHIPPEHPERWLLIECNDNGSGFLFAALLNRLRYETSGAIAGRPIEPPPDMSVFSERVVRMLRTEAVAFFGELPPGLVLILDDAASLQSGRFRHELSLLRDLFLRAEWRSEVCSPAETRWEGGRLLYRGERAAMVVNRTTDFFWEAESFSALRAAYADRSVHVAPNPFTYATRSDKRLLAFLSSPTCDAALGILPEERALLSAHVPETHVLRPENVDELARAREDFFFKPSHGFASHGLLGGAQVGRTRLRRLLKKGESYVAQRTAPKSLVKTDDGVCLWTDLRVWAYGGERFLLSGRASRRPDALDLSPPGGWLATYPASPRVR